MDSKQIQDLITSKQQEIEMLKNDLAVKELLRGIHFDKLENNVLKDVRMTNSKTIGTDPKLDSRVDISFMLNTRQIKFEVEYCSRITTLRELIVSRLSDILILEIADINFNNILNEQH